MLRTIITCLSCTLALAGPADDVPVTLRGSPESMERQHRVAREGRYAFLRTPAQVRAAVQEGELVPLRGNGAYTLKRQDFGVARPELRHFLESFSARYRAACGERLVVTSLTRPLSRQPSNAHPLSVHPAGMAMDLRVPARARCRSWLEKSLLALEREGLLDATRENRPPHYHVALFPTAYLAHLERERPLRPTVAAVAAETPSLDAGGILPAAGTAPHAPERD